MRDYMDRRVNQPKRVTSPTWGPPPPCKQAHKRFHLNGRTKGFAQTQNLQLSHHKLMFSVFLQPSTGRQKWMALKYLSKRQAAKIRDKTWSILWPENMKYFMWIFYTSSLNMLQYKSWTYNIPIQSEGMRRIFNWNQLLFRNSHKKTSYLQPNILYLQCCFLKESAEYESLVNKNLHKDDDDNDDGDDKTLVGLKRWTQVYLTIYKLWRWKWSRTWKNSKRESNQPDLCEDRTQRSVHKGTGEQEIYEMTYITADKDMKVEMILAMAWNDSFMSPNWEMK